jgi:hypothetical protein
VTGALANVPSRNVVVAESEPACVLAAISLARRLGGADLVFVRREHPGLLFEMPAHKNRTRPYRLFVLGLDALTPADAAKLDADAATRVDWLDANELSEEAGAGIAARCRGGGAWFHAPKTHHPFPAIDAAAGALGLSADPFSDTLLAIAEERLSPEDEAAFGMPWRDALAAMSSRPLELISAVKPLVHGMPRELGEYELIEGSGLRSEINSLVDGSTLIRLPLAIGPTVLLVQPAPERLHTGTLADTALARTRADVAICLFDVGDIAFLRTRRQGAEPPVSVTSAVERARRIPWVAVERLQPGSALLRFKDAPKEAARAFVAALG